MNKKLYAAHDIEHAYLACVDYLKQAIANIELAKEILSTEVIQGGASAMPISLDLECKAGGHTCEIRLACKYAVWSMLLGEWFLNHLRTPDQISLDTDWLEAKDKLPEVTRDSVMEYANQLALNQEQRNDAAILFVAARCGDWLGGRPHELKAGQKVIVKNIIDTNWGTATVRYGSATDFINLLEKCFLFLDKRELQRAYNDTLAAQLQVHLRDKGLVPFENPYFKITPHLNGNIHLVFLRADMLQEFNVRSARAYTTKLVNSRAN